jgi:hypothetical protein
MPARLVASSTPSRLQPDTATRTTGTSPKGAQAPQNLGHADKAAALAAKRDVVPDAQAVVVYQHKGVNWVAGKKSWRYQMRPDEHQQKWRSRSSTP